MPDTPAPTRAAPAPRRDFRHLPEHVPLAETTTSKPASDPPSPDFGRDPEHEWMLRFSTG